MASRGSTYRVPLADTRRRMRARGDQSLQPLIARISARASEADLSTGRFGFLPVNRAIAFDGGSFEPVSELNDLIEFVGRQTNPDKYYYPPRNPISGRPDFLFHLPASHVLRLDVLSLDLHRSEAAFLMYYLGHLF